MAKSFSFVASIGADTSALNDAIKEIDAESRKLNTELSQINRALKFDPENGELAAQRLQVMGEAAKEAEKKLTQLRSQQEAMNRALQSGDISAEYYRAYQREIASAESTVRRFARAQEEAARVSAGSFGDTMKAILASNAVSMLADVIMKASQALIELGKSAVTAYGELEQNLGGADAVFGEYAESIKKSSEEAYKVMGTSQSEYLATANKMGALFQGSGVEQERSLELTAQAMQRAADMASVMGINTEDALEAVTGAAKGNYTMMDNLGVAMNATTLKAYALSKGFDTAWESASNAEKAEIAMQYFFENTEQYAGNFEREARETVSGSIGLLTSAVESLMAGLGNSEADVTGLAQNVVDAFGAVKDNIAPVLDSIASALPEAGDTIAAAVPDMLPQLLDSIGEIFAALAGGVMERLPEFTELAVTLITDFAQRLVEALPELAEGITEMTAILINGIAEAVPELLPAAVEAVMGVAQALVDNVDVLIESAVTLITALAEGLVNSFPVLMETAPKLMLSLNSALIAAIPQLLSAVPEIFKAMGDAIKEIDWREVGDNVVYGMADAIIASSENIKEKCKALGNSVREWLGLEPDNTPVLTAQEEAEKRLEESLKRLEEKKGEIPEKYKKIQDTLKEEAEDTANAVKDANADIAEEAADIDIPDAESAPDDGKDGVLKKSEALGKALEELEHRYKTHKVTEEQYWAERKKTLEMYMDDDGEEWHEMYDKVTEHYEKLSETEAKARENALKEETSDAKKRFDALYEELKNEETTREEFNGKYLALTEELARKQIDISEYAADKIADYDRKVRKENLTAWEKSSKEITDNITKTYEDVQKAYEKAKSSFISSADFIDDKVTDKSGTERLILSDFEKQTRELKAYQKDLARLKETNISDELMEEILSMSYDSGDRQGYIKELLRMSDSQRAAYYKDYEAFLKEAENAARGEVQSDLDAADNTAKEGIKKIYGDMPKDAYEQGVLTAKAYIDGINGTMADARALRLMSSDFSESSERTGLQPAAMNQAAKTQSGADKGGYYSGDTRVVINVAGKTIIESTLNELMRKGMLSDSR
jgi:hypothetical protein|nr:MAG TPA: tail tape measure protein [Caudoviricetes sp.]